jgi:hypothetical protein
LIAERPVPVTAPGCPTLLDFEVNLSEGRNTLEMHYWKWHVAEGDQATAVTIHTVEHAYLGAAGHGAELTPARLAGER